MLDFLIYKINSLYLRCSFDLSSWYTVLELTKYLMKSESSTSIIGVCAHYNAETSKSIAQRLPSPNTKGYSCSLHKSYHRLLQNGTKTDAVSGWFLYASFYNVTGEFNATLRLTEFVLSRCSPDMLCTYFEPSSSCGHRTMHKQNVLPAMTLNERIKMAFIRSVSYCAYSSLIPEELKLEVDTSERLIPPVVISHCLRFLCYHHLCDIVNRQQALRDLYLTVKHEYLFTLGELSDSITILGTCYEMSGATDIAIQCYYKALQIDSNKSRTEERRKSKLNVS